MSITLLIARHGNTFNENEIPYFIGNNIDLPLTAIGKQQAHIIAQYCQKYYLIQAIHCGPLERHLQTASIASTYLQCPVIVQPSLNEISYGLWEGHTLDEIKTKWPAEYTDWVEKNIWPDTCFSDTKENTLNKINSWLKILTNINQRKVFLVITSQGILKLFTLLVHSLDIATQTSLQNYKVNTGHLCEIILQDSTLEVIRWNFNPAHYL